MRHFIIICEFNLELQSGNGKLGCDLCDLDLWPWPFAWSLPWSLAITPENFMMIGWWEHSQKGVTDRQTDRQTDGRTSFSMDKPTTWCKSGQVSLVSSSCLYKTQPERALAQVCHTRIDALSPDEYQFHLLLHRNSHHSQATYPKWLNH